MRRIIYLLFILLLLSTVKAANDSMSSEDKCEETGVYCNCDVNCGFQEICITRETDDSLKNFCFNPTYKINMALDNNHQGFCAKLYTRTMLPDATVYDKIRTEGTLYCEKEDVENYVEATCPVCVNTTKIEYRNITLPAPPPIVEYRVNWNIIGALLFVFSILLLAEFYYIKRRMNKHFDNKFGKKIAQFDRLKAFSPDFVKRGTAKKTEDIKQMSVEEMDKAIKNSEGRKYI